ncbi:MAG: sulfite exporter TauE/SafE family protein [Candidatus Vogelbacteria bacterium]|nr:sulfite exporter TauE/SafE family protein [Candidatus Vogelbacteria bacterium]
MSNLKKIQLKIYGTHCASCEVLIERRLKKIPGVEKVDVHYSTGKTEVFSSRGDISLKELGMPIKDDGYSITRWEDRYSSPDAIKNENSTEDYIQIGVMFLFVMALYLILQQFNLLPEGLGITNNMSYGFVFLIGLVAATSTCLAVAGGLLLTAAAKYSEMYPNLTGYQKFKPTLYFNVGRVASYTFFGGLIGALGSVISLSSRGTGILSIIASFVMIILGFQMLNLFPWMKRFQPRMPKFIVHKIHDLSGEDGKAGAFTLGGLTFFLPCGFTQALQLYVLAKGSFSVGALTMLAFSLGTLPMLLSLGAISSFAKGSFQKQFLRFSAVLVILLGFWNINNGLVLTGINISLASFTSNTSSTAAQVAPIVDGKQVVEMKVDGYSYSPPQFTIQQGVPVDWKIDASNAAGCAQVITVPTIGITKYLAPQGITTITFTPKDTGTIPFSCTMGMTTRGAAFTVIPNTGNVPVSVSTDNKSDEILAGLSSACDPKIASCVPNQRFSMEISRERGFYPKSFTVKKGVPVEITIDDQVPLGGCMSVMVIPQYQITLPLQIGTNKLVFTPTEVGTIYATCSMGIKMIQFNVI